MNHAPLLLLTIFPLTSLILGAFAIMEYRRTRQLRERVLSVSGTPTITISLPVQSIRVVEQQRGEIQLRLMRLVSFDPEVPQARIIPWPVVSAIALAAGWLCMWRLEDALGTVLSIMAGLGTSWLTARALFRWQTGRYRDAVFQQIPDALGLMVRTIRAGLPLAEALSGVARESSCPIKEEFTRVVGEIAIGRTVDTALMRVYERTALTEFSFLAVTLGLQAQTGGSLAETLDTLADMVRKRVAMAKRAKALAAEARMQAGLLFVLPFIAAAGMSVIQPFYLRTFTHNPTGQRMALIGFGLMLLGLLSIRHLIRKAGRD